MAIYKIWMGVKVGTSTASMGYQWETIKLGWFFSGAHLRNYWSVWAHIPMIRHGQYQSLFHGP